MITSRPGSGGMADTQSHDLRPRWRSLRASSADADPARSSASGPRIEALFTVTNTTPSTLPLTVNYATADGTAIAGTRLHGHQRHAHLRPRRDHRDDPRADPRRRRRQIRPDLYASISPTPSRPPSRRARPSARSATATTAAKFYVVNDATSTIGGTNTAYKYQASGTAAGALRPQPERPGPARRRDHRRRHHRMGRGRQQERLRLQHRRHAARLLVGRRPEFLAPSSPASPPTAPTSGWWIATPTRSTSTPAPPAASPAARMRPAASASPAARTATPIPRTS